MTMHSVKKISVDDLFNWHESEGIPSLIQITEDYLKFSIHHVEQNDDGSPTERALEAHRLRSALQSQLAVVELVRRRVEDY